VLHCLQDPGSDDHVHVPRGNLYRTLDADLDADLEQKYDELLAFAVAMQDDLATVKAQKADLTQI